MAGCSKALRETVISAFEAAHPYSVTLVVMDDTTIVLKLLTARGRAPWDVITINNDAAILLQAHGLLIADQSKAMPGLAEAYPSMPPPWW